MNSVAKDVNDSKYVTSSELYLLIFNVKGNNGIMLAGEKLPCSMRHSLQLLIFPQAMNNLNMIIRLGMYLRSKRAGH